MATRYNTLSDADLAGLLDALARQLATGVASLSINGQTVSYSTPAEIRNTMSEMETERERADLHHEHDIRPVRSVSGLAGRAAYPRRQ
ncbi:hypothetical protein [Cereibacter johrii]|uniref:hypothetical protein n=1 Tax=Cereibacter johrii TaxID=445629 RepID=UPI000DD474F4|nr:hypothetical protein [Cereibacter johrii]